MTTKIVEQISLYLDKYGAIRRDVSLNRNVKEIVCCVVTLQQDDIEQSNQSVAYNIKFDPERQHFSDWVKSNTFMKSTRRQMIYFNDQEFEQVRQCISTIQIIDDAMIVYQRSGDIKKMPEDHRFFVELKMLYFPNVNKIHVCYGSLHKEIKITADGRNDHN